MSGGYVLNFSNDSFLQFIFDTTKINIYQNKYAENGSSKAKLLRTYWILENWKGLK